MAHIKIDYDGLRQQAAVIAQLYGSYTDLNSRMGSLTTVIKEGWEGEGSQAYLEMMGKYLKQATLMGRILDSFKNYADGAADDFDTADRECAAKIRGAF